MSGWEQLAVSAGIQGLLYVYHRWFTDDPVEPTPPEEVLPRSDIGAAIPIIYGQCRLRTPIMVWSGNSLAPGQDYSQGTYGTSTQDHYSVDLILALGLPFDGGIPTSGSNGGTGQATLLAVWAGDTLLTSSVGIRTDGNAPQTFNFGNGSAGSSDHAQRNILFIDGVFYRGNAVQDVTVGTPANPGSHSYYSDGMTYGNGYDASAASALVAAGEQVDAQGKLTDVPGYRNQVFAYMHIGNAQNQQIPSFSFEVKSLSTNTAVDLGRSLATDADPAAVILDLLASNWSRVGLLMTRIDLPSFQAASLTLYNEAHGYSRCIDQIDDASSVISDVIKQTDGCMYVEPRTGKIVYKLIRNDYGDPAALTEINPDNAQPSGSGWYSVQSWSEIPNQVRVSFRNRNLSYATDVAIAQNGANVIAQEGRLRSLSVSYQGCCTPELAKVLAARELAVVARPQMKISVTVTRAFRDARPGSVYAFTWPQLGVNRIIMRVASVDFGQLGDGKIGLNLIRDTFDQKLGAFPVPDVE